MGHAGAIVTGGRGTVESKTAALRAAGALVAERPSGVGILLAEALARAPAGGKPAGGEPGQRA